MEFKKVLNIPNASTLINSMRSIGYDFESAVADIIDNSLSAKAKLISLFYPTETESELYFQVIDDGEGMNRDELIEAMKFGTEKNQERSKDDLGRFGLGLKTASISQCRRFSVISKRYNYVNGFCWDLDIVKETSTWDMIELQENDIMKIPNYNKVKEWNTFTIVYWEKIDKLEVDVTLLNNIQDIFLRKITSVLSHVALVFHRFIEDGIKILFNGVNVLPLDPFLSKHSKTIIKPEQFINTKTSNKTNEKVAIQVFVLPYHKDLQQEDYEKLGGAENIDNQGFYIYRNRRLMIYGTWFRIKPKNELSRNARIKVDIPNTLDDLWSIDIKKQKARIPASLLEQLRGEVADAVDKSRKIHEYKGTIQIQNDSIWNKKTDKRENLVTYEINKNSYILKKLFEGLEDKHITQIDKLLELIELSLPYKDIYNSVADKKEINKIDDDIREKLITQAVALCKEFMKTRNLKKEQIIDQICTYEPFKSANIKSELMVKTYER